MSVRLDGRAAIVTGAGRGIGRATAILLGRLGAAVVVNDIGTSTDGSGADATVAERVAAEISEAGGRAVASRDSVAGFDTAGQIVETALRSFGRLDILVNNAGLSAGAPIWELDPALFERVTASHIQGTYNCTRHAVPHMRERGWGRIVNLVSRAGLIGSPGSAAYGAGKGAVFGFTNVVSRDLASSGITVNAVNPSATDTRMVTEAVEKARRVGGEGARRADNLLAALQQPEDVAVLIAYLCSEEAAEVNGQIFLVKKGEIGLFAPLSIGQTTSKDGHWSVDELADAIPKLELNPLDSPY